MTLMEARRPETEWNASRDVARGASWAVFMRWSIRLVGLVSTVILARLLTPEDFGVAAMGMLVIGFLTQFSSLGTETHLIRSKAIDRKHCDTAWTMNLLQGLLVAALLVVLAGPAAGYFQEPRVIGVMYVLAVAAFLGSVESIGPTLARRDLRFALDYRFNVYKKLLVFLTTVSCAFLLRNYWALVLGYLTGIMAGLVLSYLMFPHRPRWCLARAPEYLRFATSILPMRIASSVHSQAAPLVVGGLGNATGLGGFTVSKNLAEMFTQEIVIPMGRGLLPNYARLAHDPRRLGEVYRSVLGLVALLCIPLGVGLSAVADDLVRLILGSQWGFAGPLIKYLALGAALSAIVHTMTQQILLVLGRERDAAVLAWLRVAVLFPLLLIGAAQEGILGVAKATVIAPIIYTPIVYLGTRSAVDLSLRVFLNLLWRPAFAAAVMYIAVRAFHPENLQWVAVRLLWDVSFGALVFCVVLIGLWLSMGRPAGAEESILRLASGRIAILRDRLNQ